VTSQADTRYVQGNILVTQNGRACLGDFGIASVFGRLVCRNHKLETLRYMALECFSGTSPGDVAPLPIADGPSKQSDVYSLAMTSFEVRSADIPTSRLLGTMLPSGRASSGGGELAVLLETGRVAGGELVWSS
jgi:serine/threonine protein kinase